MVIGVFSGQLWSPLWLWLERERLQNTDNGGVSHHYHTFHQCSILQWHSPGGKRSASLGGTVGGWVTGTSAQILHRLIQRFAFVCRQRPIVQALHVVPRRNSAVQYTVTWCVRHLIYRREEQMNSAELCTLWRPGTHMTAHWAKDR